MKQVSEDIPPSTSDFELGNGSRRGIALFSLDRGEQHFPGALLRSEPGLYLVHLHAAVAVGRRLVMVDGPYRFEVEVFSCKTSEEPGWLVTCKVLSSSRGSLRQEWRMPVDQPARIYAISQGRTLAARVKDISPFGMGVELEEALPPALQVSISTVDGFAYGEVRYCRPLAAGGFFVGILLREYVQRREKLPSRLARFALRTVARLARIAAGRA